MSSFSRWRPGKPLRPLDLRGAQLVQNAGPFRRQCAGCDREIDAYSPNCAFAPNTPTEWICLGCVDSYGLERRSPGVWLSLPSEKEEEP